MRARSALWVVCYALTIVLANWAIVTFGFVPVGFGLVAPAGVYFAGFVFTFRNLVQQTAGRRWGYAAIAWGALLSAVVAPRAELGGPLALPLASGVAFAISETADVLVWNPLRRRGWWMRAMGVGDLAGQAVDSLIFLALAFGGVELWLGQTAGKAWCTWATMAAMWLVHQLYRRWRTA